MQNWNGCSELSEHQVVTLKDIRDKNEYGISKLKDGKCWMVKNLRLGDGSIKNRTLTSEDSNVGNNYTLPYSSSYSDSSSSYSGDAMYVTSESGFYSHNIATAESGRNMRSGDAPYSICPKGWRLPTKGELDTLARRYSTTQPGFEEDFDSTTVNNLQQKPAPGMVIIGGYCGGSVVHQCYYPGQGFYWASTVWDIDDAYNINLRTNSVDSIDYTRDSKDYYGWPVRCLKS